MGNEVQEYNKVAVFQKTRLTLAKMMASNRVHPMQLRYCMMATVQGHSPIYDHCRTFARDIYLESAIVPLREHC